tara:strand:+ start:28514 stop:29095 length:582 start_codon:yes stop_codon:yes gene_type:complete
MNPNVNWFFEKNTPRKEEYNRLRTIVLDCEVKEELKWGCPCYTVNDKNVVLIHGFKDYCALLFHKGVLLKDPEKLLIQQTENVQAARQLRFTNLEEIIEKESVIKACIKDAIEVEKSGKQVEMKKNSEFDMPEELINKLENDAAFRDAWKDLTPGRKRGYLLHFSGAKQSKTRESRIEKAFPAILEGKGWNER